MDVQTFHDLVSLMNRLNVLHEDFKATTIFSPSTCPVLVTATIALLDVTNPSVFRVLAARMSIITIHRCMLLGPVYVRKTVEAGVLALLLKLASLKSGVDFTSESSHACTVLTELLRHLILVMWLQHVKGFLRFSYR